MSAKSYRQSIITYIRSGGAIRGFRRSTVSSSPYGKRYERRAVVMPVHGSAVKAVGMAFLSLLYGIVGTDRKPALRCTFDNRPDGGDSAPLHGDLVGPLDDPPGTLDLAGPHPGRRRLVLLIVVPRFRKDRTQRFKRDRRSLRVDGPDAWRGCYCPVGFSERRDLPSK
jgi:hypothetical protein